MSVQVFDGEDMPEFTVSDDGLLKAADIPAVLGGLFQLVDELRAKWAAQLSSLSMAGRGIDAAADILALAEALLCTYIAVTLLSHGNMQLY